MISISSSTTENVIILRRQLYHPASIHTCTSNSNSSWNSTTTAATVAPTPAHEHEAKNTVNMQTRVKNNNNVKWFSFWKFHLLFNSVFSPRTFTAHIFRTCATFFRFSLVQLFLWLDKVFFLPFFFLFGLNWFGTVVVVAVELLLVAAFTSF